MQSCPAVKPPPGSNFTSDEHKDWFETEFRENCGFFHKVDYYRVILDEAHIIRNKRSRNSVACQRLNSKFTWCLTGTPIINILEDIYPYFSFIRHPIFGNWDKFREHLLVKSPHVAAQRIRTALQTCSMRRTKDDVLMGQPLISLPRKRERLVELEFTPDERHLYDSFEDQSKQAVNRALSNAQRHGGKMSNEDYNAILVYLLRLRQCASHPWLVLHAIAKRFPHTELESLISATTPGGPINLALKNILSTRPEPADFDEAYYTAHAKGHSRKCQDCSLYSQLYKGANCTHVFCADCLSDLPVCPRCEKPLNKQFLSDDEKVHRGLEMPGFTHSTKTKALARQIVAWLKMDVNQKVVVFSIFTHFLDVVQAMLETEEALAGWGWQRYQGSMSLDERESALSCFRNDDDCKVLLTSMKAGGVGLNLTKANLVVSLDLWWNKAMEDQAFARVYRLGQEKEVEVERFMIKDTVEQRVRALQRKKEEMAKIAMGEGGMEFNRLGVEEIAGLFGEVVRDGVGGIRVV